MHERREHAIHNLEACRFLKENSNFNDWVITTAYYTANHFVRYKIFPHTIDNQTFKSFDECYNRYNHQVSKHNYLGNLVAQNLPPINEAFWFLIKACHSARYYDYKVSTVDVERSMRHLEQIVRHCNTNKPAKRDRRTRINPKKKL